MSFKSKLYKYLFYVAIFIILLLSFFILVGCGSVEQREYKQPADCDDMDRFVKMTGKMTGLFSKENTSAAVALNLVTLSWSECRKSRTELKDELKEQNKIISDQKRFDDCKFLIYGDKIEAKKENYKKHDAFVECRKKNVLDN